MEPVRGPAATCPQCHGGNLDFHFDRPFGEFAHMIVGGELVMLEAMPVSFSCKDCPWRLEAMGEEITIDIEQGVVLFCRIPTE